MRLPITRSAVVALLFAALALARPVVAAPKQGSNLFQRVKRSLQSVASAVGGGSEAAAAAVEDMSDAVAEMLEQQQKERTEGGVDMWAADGSLKMAMQALKGDQLGVLRMLGRTEGLKEIWSDPQIVRNLLDNMPVFRGIKKMAAIADKEGPLTSEDGLAALGAFQEYIDRSASALEGVLDPGKFAEKLHAYQTTKESALRALFEQVEAGDAEAILMLQEELVKRELGDIVDLEEFGLRGEEPQAVSALRNMIKEQDPEIYRLVVSDDEYVRRFMADPAQALEDAKRIDPNLAKVAEAIKAGSRRHRRNLAAEQAAAEAEKEEGEPVAA